MSEIEMVLGVGVQGRVTAMKKLLPFLLGLAPTLALAAPDLKVESYCDTGFRGTFRTDSGIVLDFESCPAPGSSLLDCTSSIRRGSQPMSEITISENGTKVVVRLAGITIPTDREITQAEADQVAAAIGEPYGAAVRELWAALNRLGMSISERPLRCLGAQMQAYESPRKEGETSPANADRR